MFGGIASECPLVSTGLVRIYKGKKLFERCRQQWCTESKNFDGNSTPGLSE